MLKKKTVLKFIKKNEPVEFHLIKEYFCDNDCKDYKYLSKIIKNLLKNEEILYHEKNKTYSVNEDFQKNKKIDKKKKYKNKTKSSTDDFMDILEKYDIPEHFPKKVLSESDSIDESSINEVNEPGREDLRDLLVVTIDGNDSKDFDDAVSIEKTQSGWKLGVHIADVSRYVQKGSPLDKEAFKRANSYYLLRHVVPMLPEKLSNGICSLNPEVDRLTLSVMIHINSSGTVENYRFSPSIIHSNYRLTYERVQKYFDDSSSETDPQLKETLDEMQKLFKILYQKRIKEGGIDFDFKEEKCRLDENDQPLDFWLKDRLDSERLIEEFMLSANQCAAKYLSKKGPSLFRVHQDPEPDKIQEFLRFMLKFGHHVEAMPVPDSRRLQEQINVIKNKPYRQMIQFLLLRTMQQARYETNNIGHFGLGFEYYTHFTSPIRRYADLIVHRLIKESLMNEKTEKKEEMKFTYSVKDLDEIAAQTSKMERIAMDAEREFFKRKATRFMADKTGKIFNGIISGVTDFGLFVQLQPYGIDGLCRYQDLGDEYFQFHEDEYSAVGKKTKTKYTLGDSVTVKVIKVNTKRFFIDLIITKKNQS